MSTEIEDALIVIVLRDGDDGDVDVKLESQPALPKDGAGMSPAQTLAVHMMDAAMKVSDRERGQQ